MSFILVYIYTIAKLYNEQKYVCLDIRIHYYYVTYGDCIRATRSKKTVFT